MLLMLFCTVLKSMNIIQSVTTDIGACEQIISKKNGGDFQEYLQTEHSK